MKSIFNIKNFINFLIKSNVYVAMSVCSLMISVCIILGLKIHFFATGILFFGTIISYYFTKQGNFIIRSTSLILCVLFCFFCFFNLQWKSQIIIILNSILSIFYILPIKRKNLRSISFIKIFIVAFCWILGSVWLPIFEDNYLINKYVYWISLQYFIWVIVLILPFDIRDKKYDTLKIITFPTKFGVIFTKILGFILVLLFLTISYFINKNSIWYSQFISGIITALFLYFSKEQQSKYYCNFWVESVPIFYLILLILLQ